MSELKSKAGGKCAMLKIALAGFGVILLSCVCFYGYRWYATAPAALLDEPGSTSYEDVKTDFVSIAIFKDGKVDGYVSFRSKLSIIDADKTAVAGYVIADTIHRKLSVFADIFGGDHDPKSTIKSAKLLEAPLLAALSVRLGEGTVSAIQLVDIGFDKRIE